MEDFQKQLHFILASLLRGRHNRSPASNRGLQMCVVQLKLEDSIAHLHSEYRKPQQLLFLPPIPSPSTGSTVRTASWVGTELWTAICI